MEIIGMLLMFLGILISLAGSIWFLIVAFQESVLWGLGCLIIPIVSLIFLVMHLDKAGKPFLVNIAGLVPLFLGMFLSTPSV